MTGTGVPASPARPELTARAFLTSAGLMATHANANQSSPVFRGKFVREQLMCNTLPLPPNDLVIEPPELDPNKTTKEQFEEIGANRCMRRMSHVLMNPIGFIFEHYDGVGQWRDQQNGKDIDAVGDVVQTDDIDGELRWCQSSSLRSARTKLAGAGMRGVAMVPIRLQPHGDPGR